MDKTNWFTSVPNWFVSNKDWLSDASGFVGGTGVGVGSILIQFSDLKVKKKTLAQTVRMNDHQIKQDKKKEKKEKKEEREKKEEKKLSESSTRKWW